MPLELIKMIIEAIDELSGPSKLIIAIVMIAVILGSIAKIIEFLSKIYDGLSALISSARSRLKGQIAHQDFFEASNAIFACSFF